MKFINYIQPVDPRRARGTVADIYAEARRDFGRVPEPVVMWAPNEALLAAGWAALRETLIAGQAPRAHKEAVAAAVAAGLRCPWCVDAHTTMLYAAGEARTAAAILAGAEPTGATASFVEWARGTAAPAGPPAPFGPGEAAEYIGTALAFHFTTRMVLVLLDETFLPGGPRVQTLMRRAAGRAFSRRVRATHPAGLAVERLPDNPLSADLAWAATNPPIGRAFAAMTACLDSAEHLPQTCRDTVERAVQGWRGEQMPISSSWTTKYTEGLPGHLQPPTRLALLTSLAPHQVTEADVASARPVLDSDTAFVTALAWASWTATRRIATWVARPTDFEAVSGEA